MVEGFICVACSQRTDHGMDKKHQLEDYEVLVTMKLMTSLNFRLEI